MGIYPLNPSLKLLKPHGMLGLVADGATWYDIAQLIAYAILNPIKPVVCEVSRRPAPLKRLAWLRPAIIAWQLNQAQEVLKAPSPLRNRNGMPIFDDNRESCVQI